MRSGLAQRTETLPSAGRGPLLQRKCDCGGTCSRCRPSGTLQAEDAGDTHRFDAVTAPARQTLAGAGRPMSGGERAPMEQRFGQDFSRVRVHDDADASRAAASVGAEAFAFGDHVVLGRAAKGNADTLAHELGHVAANQGMAPALRRKGACKNQDKIDAVIKANPRKYDLKKVTMKAHVITKGDTLDQLATDTLGDNTVFVPAHYKREILALNKGLKVGTVGNCALVLDGWKDPNIGALPAAPAAKALTDEAKHAIATIYAEQTGTGTQAAKQQEYIWYSIRHRLDLGLHGPTIDDVLNKGGYWGKGTADYKAALKELNGKGAASAGVVGAQNAVLGKWSASLPRTSASYYFHWRKEHAMETCYKTAIKKKTAAADAEKACAWKYAHDNGIAGVVPKSEGWHHKIASDSGDRIGSMYLYRFAGSAPTPAPSPRPRRGKKPRSVPVNYSPDGLDGGALDEGEALPGGVPMPKSTAPSGQDDDVLDAGESSVPGGVPDEETMPDEDVEAAEA